MSGPRSQYHSITQTALGWDKLNYKAILELEHIGEYEPSQTQIDLMEEILRISRNKKQRTLPKPRYKRYLL